MQRFLKVSILILLAQCFIQDVSFSLDTEERRDNPKITFSAHQKLFHAKLEKLKKKITKFPSIFISYSRRDKDQNPLINAITQDLIAFGFDIEANRPGGGSHSHTYVDRIKTADKVLLIGSPFLKQDYDNATGGEDSSEINNIRTRASSSDGLKGIIPLWFNGAFEDNFPWGISYFPARYVEKKSIFDTNYFTHFFELLMDIFHTEEGGEKILNVIQKKKESFIRQSKIPKETLRKYGQLYLQKIQEQKDKDEAEVNEALFRDFESFKDPKSSQVQARIETDQQKGEKFIDLNGEDTSIKEDEDRPRQWNKGSFSSRPFNLPNHHHNSFIESIPQDQQDSYLTLVWKKLDGHPNQDSILRKCVIPGLGGMGKSRLARAYAHEALAHGVYDAIIWFQLNREFDDTQNISSLETQYREWFAEVEENIKTDIAPRALFNLFKNKVTQRHKHPLIIYDDVPSGDFLRDLLPQINTHILITSRDALGWEWDEMIPPLEEFHPEESIKFLQQKSGRKVEEEKDDVLEVAEVLGGLPLALEQAASWVRVKKKPFAEYLKEFTTKAKELMKYKAQGSDYPYVVATTWGVSMDNISEDAQKLMKYFAYLSSDDIPVSLFEELDPENAIDELAQYSMINRHNNHISVHQLVQLVNRNDDGQEVLQGLIRLFVNKAGSLFKLDLNKPQNQELFLRYSLHAFKLSQHAKSLMKKEDDLLERFEWERLVITLGGITTFFEESRELQKYHQQDSSIQQILEQVMEEKDLFMKEFKGNEKSAAFKWLYKVAEESHYMIQIFMGLLYKFSNIISCNYKKIFKWYRLAAEQGSAYAQFRVGEMYYDGRGIKSNNAKAVKWYQLAAEQGHIEAQSNLGKMYKDALGTAKDEVEAVKWYKLAAAQGNANAQYWLGIMYEGGRGGLSKDDTEAVKWWSKAAKQKYENALYKLEKAAEQGNSYAQDNLGTMYYYGRGVEQDYSQAYESWEKASQQNNYIATANLSLLYKEGFGVETNLQKAFDLSRKSAEAKDGFGLYCLALLCRDGEGTQQDDKQAIELLERSCKKGQGDAFYTLGWMYRKGRGVEKNKEKAREYYKKGKELQAESALYDLGRMYEKGLGGIAINKTKAKKWYKKAAALGNELAQKNLEKLEQLENSKEGNE